MNAPTTFGARLDALPRFASPLKAIESLKPIGAALSGASRQIRRRRAAVPRRLSRRCALCGEGQSAPQSRSTNLWTAGIRHFDTAILGEIEIVKGLFPDAICHFMAPVRLPGQAKAAFEKHGVTDYRGRLRLRAGQAAGRNRQSQKAARLRAAGGAAGRRAAGNVEQIRLPRRRKPPSCSSGCGARAPRPASPSMSARNACRPFPMPRRSRSPSAPSTLSGRRDRGAGYRRRLSRRLFRTTNRRPITGIST